MATSEISDDELRVFVGPRAETYLEKWSRRREGLHAITSRNWAAFLFCGFWLPYRKMYRVTFIAAILVISYAIIEEMFVEHFFVSDRLSHSLTAGIGIFFAAICGAFGNRWYYRHAIRMITKVKAEGKNPEQKLDTIRARGGTSVIAVVVAWLLFLIFSSALFIFSVHAGILRSI